MAQRKAFLLRLDPATHEALQRWADADLRSLNAQIEFLLRRALQDAGRLKSAEDSGGVTSCRNLRIRTGNRPIAWDTPRCVRSASRGQGIFARHRGRPVPDRRLRARCLPGAHQSAARRRSSACSISRASPPMPWSRACGAPAINRERTACRLPLRLPGQRSTPRSVRAPLVTVARVEGRRSPLAVRFVPSQPTISHPVDWPWRGLPFWFPYFATAMMAGVGALLAVQLARQMRLLAEGRPAPGRVTGIRKDKGIVVRYEFELLNGATFKGRAHVQEDAAGRRARVRALRPGKSAAQRALSARHACGWTIQRRTQTHQVAEHSVGGLRHARFDRHRAERPHQVGVEQNQVAGSRSGAPEDRRDPAPRRERAAKLRSPFAVRGSPAVPSSRALRFPPSVPASAA